MATKKVKPITVKDYASLAEVRTASISYRIVNKLILPGIKAITYNDTTRQYELTRDKTLQDVDIKKYFRNKNKF